MQRNKSIPENFSKEYKAAWMLINGEDEDGFKETWKQLHGKDYQEEKCEETPFFSSIPHTSTFQKKPVESEKSILERTIRELKKSIKEIDNQIRELNAENVGETLCCLLGCLMELDGIVSIGTGISDISDGNTIIGSVEIASGAASMYIGDRQIDKAMDAMTDISIEQSKLNANRQVFKNELEKCYQQMYQIEKNETLQTLNLYAKPASLLYQAVTQQFDAMDKDIQQGKFSKCYVDAAINTKKILTETNEKKRNEYADKHLAIVTKKSVSKIVGGSMLMFLGVALIATTAVLMALFIETGPIAILGGAIGLGVGLGSLIKGCQTLKSGLPRKTSPLVSQSLFNVAKAAKEEPIRLYNSIRKP